jgi:glycosyltransferase involved in cell wall biosynthesis
MPGSLDGGLANYIRKVSLALAERGHQVSVLLSSNRTACWQDQHITVREIRRFVWPVPARRIRSHHLHAALVASERIASARRLAKAAWAHHAESAFDILQASSYQAPGYSLLHNGRIPIVCRVSSYTPLWRSAYGRQRNLGELLSDWLEARQVLDAEAAFAPSRLTADAYARLEGFRPELIRTPVDSHVPPLDDSYYREHLVDVKYLLFFGTLSRIKGIDLLAEALPSILQHRDDLAFVFVGRDDGLPGGQKALDFLRSRCEPFAHRLHFYGVLPKSQLYPIIANAQAVLLPSRVDNYPNACLEAQAMGVPVIGTYDSSIDEMVVDGETGFLASNGDPVSISYAIERLLALTPQQRQHMRTQILSTIESIRAEDRIGQLINFYELVIDNF